MLRRLRSLLPLARYQVEGDSMTPALSSGERVLVNRVAYWLSRPRPGDLVVVRDPRQRDRLLLKRIDRSVGDDAWTVLGDNVEASTDSRAFGPVGRKLLVGKVWLRY